MEEIRTEGDRIIGRMEKIMKKVIYDSREQKKIGMLTPSSNTTLEPICSNMVAGNETIVTMHYGRFSVTKISLEEDALAQFDMKPMLQAARLLADADVDVIAWNGTSGGWLGFDIDRQLCARIEEETGIPATTSMLAQIQAFQEDGVKRVHLITPYLSKINELIIEEYRKCGIEVVSSVCLNQFVNRSFALVPQEKIKTMFEQVCQEPADGVSVVCTNFPAMWSAAEMEETYHTKVYDTINTVVWAAMKMIGISPGIVKGWGKLFDDCR